MNSDQKLENFAVKEIKRNLHNLIVETDANEHVAFGAYVLKKTESGVSVYNRAQDLVGEFSSQRSALSYCVADKYHNINLSLQIRSLDTKKQILANDIACHRGLAYKSKQAEFRELVNTKLSNKVSQHRAVSSELEKCINSAKYLQIKGFQNETARVFSN